MRRSILVFALLTIAVGCGYAWYLPGGLTVNFAGLSGDPLKPESLRQKVTVPAGFTISTWASGVPGRMLRFTAKGDLLASVPTQGKILLLEADANGDGAADGTRVLVSGLNRPHGLDIRDGWLYIAEGDAVARVRFDAEARTAGERGERIVRGIPSGGNHWTRTVRVGPDGDLYVSVGSSCNACIEDDPRRAAILRYRIDGTGEEIFATGLRNSVGFDWRPGTNELYATDNGRDLLGDDFPPEELNRVVQGGFYGWPFASGDRVPDPDNGAGHEARIAASIPPVHGFAAHTAPLGIAFYDATAFPQRYRGAAFVALHGSWNRARKSGYEVVAIFFDENGKVREEPFATGFEIGEEVYGRPVDVAVGPDGALYVSDDFTSSIYRIAYGDVAKAASGAPVAPTAPAGDPLAGLSAAEREPAFARGRDLFDANDCGSCHVAGKQKKGETYKPLLGLPRKYSLDSLAAFLAAPQPPMPLYPLSAAERRDLAVYLLASESRDQGER